jgi:egghead protein (zeste-white 4 protein)
LLENVVMVILASFWFSTIPVAFLTLGRFLKNRNIFVEQDLRRIYNDPIIIFQITTRSATKTHVVKRGIDSIINSSLEINYNNYQICIITDDAKDKTTLNGVNCEVIVVDKKFTASAIKKGRALQ